MTKWSHKCFFVLMVLALPALAQDSAPSGEPQDPKDQKTINSERLFGASENGGSSVIFGWLYQWAIMVAPKAQPINKPSPTVASEDERVQTELEIFDIHHSAHGDQGHLLTEVYGAILEEEAMRHQLIQRHGDVFEVSGVSTDEHGNSSYDNVKISPSLARTLWQTLVQSQKEKKAEKLEADAARAEKEKELSGQFYKSITSDINDLSQVLKKPDITWSDLLEVLNKARSDCEVFNHFEDTLSPRSLTDVVNQVCSLGYTSGSGHEDCFSDLFWAHSGAKNAAYSDYRDAISSLYQDFQEVAREKLNKNNSSLADRSEFKNIFSNMVQDINDPHRLNSFINEAELMDYLSSTILYFPSEILQPFAHSAIHKMRQRELNDSLKKVRSAQTELLSEFSMVKRDHPDQLDLQKAILGYSAELQNCAYNLSENPNSETENILQDRLVAGYEDAITLKDKEFCCGGHKTQANNLITQTQQIERKYLDVEQVNLTIEDPLNYFRIQAELGTPLTTSAKNVLMAKKALAEAQSVLSSADHLSPDDPEFVRLTQKYGEEILDQFGKFTSIGTKAMTFDFKQDELSDKLGQLENTPDSENQIVDLKEQMTSLSVAKGLVYEEGWKLQSQLTLKARQELGDDFSDATNASSSKVSQLSRTIGNDGQIKVIARYEIPGLRPGKHEYRIIQVEKGRDDKRKITYWENGKAKPLPAGAAPAE